MNKNNYVYVYRVDNKPVYVGIGSHEDLENKIYLRAKQISGHLEVAKQKFKEVKISIVADDLTRSGARLIETILIKQFSVNFDLINLNISSNRKEAEHIIFTRTGITRKQYDKVENKKLEFAYLELLSTSPLYNKINLTKKEKIEYKNWMYCCSKKSGYRVKGLYFDEGAKERKAAFAKTTVAKTKAAAKHLFMSQHSNLYTDLKNAKTAVYKFKKTKSNKLENAIILLEKLELAYKNESPALLKQFAIEYFD